MSTLTKRLSGFVLLVLLLSACATVKAATSGPGFVPGNNPYAPQNGDSALSSDTATYESTVLSQTGSQVQLDLAYRLPTPCHQVRLVVTPPDASGQIKINLYSVFESGKPCALMALATPLHAKLDLGTFTTGHYSLWVNDVQATSFDVK